MQVVRLVNCMLNLVPFVTTLAIDVNFSLT